MNIVPQVRSDAESFAASIDLHYTHSGSEPCFRRRRAGRGFTYRHSELGSVRINHELRPWLDGLAIPPAWTDVWISPVPNGHLLATGYDEAQRKQYRYHGRWSTARRQLHDSTLVNFARRLPVLRREIARLIQTGSPDERMLAAATRILDRTGIRVGNPSSVQVHSSRGLTTLVDDNLETFGSRVRLRFVGKGGVDREVDVRAPEVVSLLEDAAEHDEDHLFSWEEDGETGHVTASMVNSFLKEHLGPGAHAHQFRSWLCTWRTLDGLRSAPGNDISSLLTVLEPIAEELGHTVSTARGHYLHHRVEPAWVSGQLPRPYPIRQDELSLSERRAIAVLEALRECEPATQ